MKTEHFVFGVAAAVVICACVLVATKSAPPEAFTQLAIMIVSWLMPSPLDTRRPQLPQTGGDK